MNESRNLKQVVIIMDPPSSCGAFKATEGREDCVRKVGSNKLITKCSWYALARLPRLTRSQARNDNKLDFVMGLTVDKQKIPKHVAIIMDPPAQHCFAQTAYSAVLQTGCFGGREKDFGGWGE